MLEHEDLVILRTRTKTNMYSIWVRWKDTYFYVTPDLITKDALDDIAEYDKLDDMIRAHKPFDMKTTTCDEYILVNHVKKSSNDDWDFDDDQDARDIFDLIEPVIRENTYYDFKEASDFVR